MSLLDRANIVQFTDNGSLDHPWQFASIGKGWHRIRNRNSGLVLGVSDMSTADGAQVVQFEDSGTADHLWQFH